MLERIDPLRALADDASRTSKLALNMRVGEALTMEQDGGHTVVVRLVAKHGQGARVEIEAVRAVRIHRTEHEPIR